MKRHRRRYIRSVNMAQFSQKNIEVDGLTLHTESFGNITNPACVLIAPKQATARFWTGAFCTSIADQEFFVIRYDHRDVGESSEIDWQKEPYTMSDMAQDAISIMNGYGIKQAHFVGNSMGGWICQQIGVDYPDRILSLTIISAGPLEITDAAASLTAEEQQIMDNTLQMFIARKDGATLEDTVQSYLPIWRHCNGDVPCDDEMAKNFTKDFLTRTTHKHAGQNHELMMGQFLATMKPLTALQKIDRPTLVIYGDKDPVVPPRCEKSVADAIPGAKLVMIKGMGHTMFNRDLEKAIATMVVEHMKAKKTA